MIKICQHCGREFDGHNASKNCPDCKSKVRVEYAREYRKRHREQLREQLRERRRRNRKPIFRVCEMCGREFESSRYAKFCPDCREVAYRRNKNAARRQQSARAKVVALRNKFLAWRIRKKQSEEFKND